MLTSSNPPSSTSAAMSPEDFTAYLHRNIPLTAAVGARILSAGDGELVLAAPLTPNLNHRNTAFGGSLSTIGILSAWALLHHSLSLKGFKSHLVIQRSECDFLEPVADEFIASCTLPSHEWHRFLKTLARRRRARIEIESEIHCGAAKAVVHRGTFVALDGSEI